ncbi:MAG TPA: efflux RND transporter periplasmic adaptor subunit [Microscillaceae bacterium]|jgi:RND family efflux transporter MFP subunit|nr:efflux RND transporter periplasmic adaptor subunit [Microscillaceae bacterium]
MLLASIFHKHFGYFLLLGGLHLGLVACSGEAKDKKKQVQDELIAVRTAPVERLVVDRPVLSSGVVSSAAEARLAFKTGGVIDKILVVEGQNIVKGQLLATLNLTEISAQAQQAQENLAKAERDLERAKNLYEDSVATKEQYQNASTAYNIAKQSTVIAGFNQSYSEIRASLTGKVMKKIMNEGEVVSPGTPVFMISATTANDWVIKVGLSDRDWARLQVGDPAEINLDAYPDQPLKGFVRELAETADPVTGTFECEVSLIPQADIKFAAGLIASVEIKPKQNQSQLVIPLAALVETKGKTGIVFILDEQQIARRKEIRIAFLSGDKVVVAQGLDSATQVITAGSPYLSEGQKVVVQQ